MMIKLSTVLLLQIFEDIEEHEHNVGPVDFHDRDAHLARRIDIKLDNIEQIFAGRLDSMEVAAVNFLRDLIIDDNLISTEFL